MGEDGDRVAPRLARGCRCFAVRDGDELAAYGWMSTRAEWIGELALELTPDTAEAYIWNCMTLPRHRRKGLYRALLEDIVSRARAEGLRTLWIGSIEVPAEKADADAGFVPVLHFSVQQLAGVRLLRARPAPGASPELVAAARARLRLSSALALGRARTHVH